MKKTLYGLAGDLSYTATGDGEVTCYALEVRMAMETKERILTVTLEMFSQKTYEGTNIRELSASLVEISKS